MENEEELAVFAESAKLYTLRRMEWRIEAGAEAAEVLRMYGLSAMDQYMLGKDLDDQISHLHRSPVWYEKLAPGQSAVDVFVAEREQRWKREHEFVDREAQAAAEYQTKVPLG